jgi:hypothetical protein
VAAVATPITLVAQELLAKAITVEAEHSPILATAAAVVAAKIRRVQTLPHP